MLKKEELSRRRQGLSAAKQVFLAKRLSRETLVDVPTVLPRRAARWQEMAPASFAQQRLWLLHQLDSESPIYHIFYIMRLQGSLDQAVLAQSLNEIVRRHEVLRTTFVERNGTLLQWIHPHATLPLPSIDLSVDTEDVQKQKVDQLLSQAAHEPFDLQNGPLLRPLVVRLSEQEHLLIMVFHHIISDDWSVSVLNRELTLLYSSYSADNISPLAELPVQYADYSVWQREQLQGGLGEEQRSYWLQQLQGAPPVLELPTDYTRQTLQSFRGETLGFVLPPKVVRALKDFCNSEGVTLFMALLATFQILLARYTGQEDIVVGSPIANRTHAEVEGLIGFFVNTLVLRTHLTGKPSFREVIKRVRTMTLEAYDHQDMPFEQLVEILRPERKLNHNPLFQVMFALQNAPKTDVELQGLTLQPIKFTGEVAKFDLSLLLLEEGDGIQGDFEYSTDLFERKTVEQFIAHFCLLVEDMLDQPDTCIWDLPLLTEEERQQMLLVPSVYHLSLPRDPDFLDLFAAQVRRTPQAIAASVCGTSASYQELDARSNYLADLLVSYGVGAESRVVVVDQRGLSLLAALLAIFKAGAAYVPIDPVQPVERVRQLLEGSGARVVLAGTQFQPMICQAMECWEQETLASVLELAAWENLGSLPAFQAVAPSPHQLAYVLFTSGSTGVPKGAMIEQEGMLNHLLCKVKDLRLSAEDRVGQIASQSFDVSIWQMLAILLVGGRVQVLRDEISHDPRRLLEQIDKEELSVAQMVPSLLGALLEELDRLGERRPAFSHLRWMMTSGEALPPDLCRRWLKLYPHVSLVNAYGPTEAADNATHALITQLPSAQCLRTTIGKALDNTRLYVLGKYGELLPRGAYGELYIGGTGVGRGYLGDACKTAAAFLPDEWSGTVGSRLYRTGDVVRYLEDGSLEFVGRKDNQVKLRGYRIELGEIEEVIRTQEGVREVVVVLRDIEGEEKRLVAYVVGIALDEDRLREEVAKRLPAYMVPWTWIILEEMPLMINGKIDRKRLPAPQRKEPEEQGGYREPGSELEEILAEIWSELLGIERVGIDENFFALGGHSLLATRFLAHMQEDFRIEIPLLLIFQKPTIAELAAFILQQYQYEEKV